MSEAETGEGQVQRILKNIRDIRVDKRISQDMMAESLGFSQSAYARFEGGNTKTDLVAILKICALFDISFGQLENHHRPELQRVGFAHIKKMELFKQQIDFLRAMLQEKERVIQLLKQQVALKVYVGDDAWNTLLADVVQGQGSMNVREVTNNSE